MSMRTWSVGALLGLGAAVAVFATAQDGPENPQKKLPEFNEVVQGFPSNGEAQTAWKVRWREESGPGLIIQDAYFKKGPEEPWVQVLGEARLAEAFVPYHRGTPRFWDVSYNFGLCPVTDADAGPRGELLSSTPKKGPTVVKEIRDQGLAWKDAAGVRRGEWLVLWGTLSAANYRYVIEYSFRDDGQIRFNLGATGHNYPGSEWEPHMHNHLWRVDVNLDGADHNSVDLCEHLEPDPRKKKSEATTLHTPVEAEGYFDYVPEKFTMLTVSSTQKKNARDKAWSYDLVPQRMGNARHYGGDKEACFHHDFWVTRNRKGEIYPTKLPDYVKDPANPQQGEGVADTDVVLWYNAPGHHEPRSEDGEKKQNARGRREFRGATPIMWCTFELRPRDFWDRSPLFPYAK